MEFKNNARFTGGENLQIHAPFFEICAILYDKKIGAVPLGLVKSTKQKE